MTHFQKVLETGWTPALWICYITAFDDPQPDEAKFDNYIKLGSKEEVENEPSPANQIKMFMSVTSMPESLVTTHLGISTTVENTYKPIKKLSLLLHSFAAKVMLLENKDRRFMFTTPVPVMGALICKNLKKVYVGRKGQLKTDVLNADGSFKSFSEYYAEAKWKQDKSFMESDDMKQLTQLPTLLAGLKSYWNSLDEVEKQVAVTNPKKFLNKARGSGHVSMSLVQLYADVISEYVLFRKTGPELDEEVAKRNLKKIVKGHYKNRIGLPSNLMGDLVYPGNEQKWANFLISHPGIIKISNDPQHFIDIMDFYDPENLDKVWLKIDWTNDKIYGWVWLRAFRPSGAVDYLTVDLHELADFLKLENED